MSIGILAMVNHTALRIVANEMRSKRSLATGNWTLVDALVDLNGSNSSFAGNNESALNRRGAEGFSPASFGSADQCPEYHAQALSFVSRQDVVIVHLWSMSEGILNFKEGEFVWTKKEQSLVLVAYFYGYLSSQIAGTLTFYFNFPAQMSELISCSKAVGLLKRPEPSSFS